MQNIINDEKLKNGKIVNLVGQTFNSLTVIELAYSKDGMPYWICKCKCGEITRSIANSRLINGTAKSCEKGLCNWQIYNLIGQTFGSLIVVEFAYVKQGNAYWICRCKCGKMTSPISSCNLKRPHGPVKTCGNSLCSGRTDNLIGNIYGFLTVLKFGGMGADSRASWICECLLCGKITDAILAQSLKAGLTKTCGCCRNVKETQVKNILEIIYEDGYETLQEQKIEFLGRQHLDIVLIDKKTGNYFLAAERDGEQHERPVKFGGSQEKAEKDFKNRKIRDAKKNRLMKKNKHIVPYFVRIKWDEEITEENIIRILKKNGVPVPDKCNGVK